MKSTWRTMRTIGAILAVAALAGACVSPEMKRKAAIDGFLQKTSGDFHNEKGELFLIPVVARMVAYDTMYVEKRDASGNVTTARLVSIDYSPKSDKVVQQAMAFTTEGQWRNLRENPELFTALLPKDVRPAGSCNITLAEDGNSVSYSCSGSPPETFQRRH